MIDIAAVLGDTAAVVDPKGENEVVSTLCGLVAWAVEHPDEYRGWDFQTVWTALRWSFEMDADGAAEMATQLVGAPV